MYQRKSAIASQIFLCVILPGALIMPSGNTSMAQKQTTTATPPDPALEIETRNFLARPAVTREERAEGAAARDTMLLASHMMVD